MPKDKKVLRKLSAILSADVKGYSLLMADDEVHTIETLKAYRQIISGLVSEHSGRVVDSPGDNILAEFRSSVDAVECAVKVQKRLDKENSKFADDKKVKFRIGVNIGEVIQDGDHIYGNGVNVAARIEGLADPGGVCISRNAYDHISNKLTLGYEYLGEHSVKNITKPVRVYKLLMAEKDAGKLIGDVPKPVAKKWIWATVLLAAIVITFGIWQVYQKMAGPEFEPAKIEKMAYPLPDKPSIAVLPFDNLSGDPEQEYFTDGLSEEIITTLSKVPDILVIARNSTFTYKGKPVNIKQVAEELGVKYVLEGSVRKDKDEVRITAQLINALTGYHMWSDRYDRNLKDIFAVQDEIALKILGALEVKLTDGEQAILFKKGINNIDVYLHLLQGFHYLSNLNPENNSRARKIFEDAISQEPDYSIGYTFLAGTYLNDVMLGTTKSPKESYQKAAELAKKSLSIDPSQGGAYGILGGILIKQRNWDEGISLLYKSVELEPNSAFNLLSLGINLCFADRPEEAIPIIKKGLRINPTAPSGYFNTMAIAYRMLEKYDQAIEYLEAGIQRSPDELFSHLNLSACYILAGREQDAYAEAKEVLRLNPNFTVDQFDKALQLKNQEEKKRFIGALREAFSFQGNSG